jgi:ABC-2 type transport system permease protein
MSGAIRAEWTKLRTLPSTIWLLAAGAAVTVTASAIAAAAWHVNAGSSADPTKISLTGIDVGQAVVAVLAVLVISEEYGTGMIRTSLSAIPRRLDLLAAKAANLVGLVLPVGLVAVAGSLLAGRLLLPNAGIDPAHGDALVSLSQDATLRAAIGSVLYLILIALLSLGVATIVRDTAASVGAVLALIYLPPVAAQLVQDPTWRRHLEQIGPMTAGLATQATTSLRSQPIGPWAGLGVLAAWAVGALVLGGLLLRLRDA